MNVDGRVPLDSVLCTDELNRRPSRPPEYEKENRALLKLSRALASSPRTILQALADTILETFQAGSSGVSLLSKESGGKYFYWPAIAGMWKPHTGGGTPRDFGPCGDVLDRGEPLMFRHFEWRYTYLLPVTPPVEECLLVPFRVNGEAVGTIWAISHSEHRKFDNEDLRLLMSLADFTSAAYQTQTALESAVEHADAAARLAAIVDSSDDAIIGRTLDGVITSWNRSAEKMFGYSAAEAIGQSISLLIPDDRIAEENDVLKRVRRGERVDHFETDRLSRDGRRISLSLTASPIRDAAGQVIGVSGVAREITERKRMEAALRHSELRYRRLFQTAKDGILILDATTGRIIDANAFMCGLLGQELFELTRKELHEIGLFSDIAANKAAFEHLQQNGYIRYDHLPVMKSNGESTQVEFISNVYEEDGRLVAQCNVRDVTARFEMERKIRQQAEALADQHRRKDEFLAMLSHELRNPLAAIRSAAHLLKMQEAENSIEQQGREVIERQVSQLTRLVSDLMEVSRVVTGRIRLNMQNLDLRQIVEHALETAAPIIENRRHEVVLTLPPDPVWVTGDATRLEEVVVNLLNNAAKYTRERGRIEVILERKRNSAILRVRDTGMGIAPELLPRIFDLFTQAERSLNRSEGGLGIGLHLVQELVELHGGTVEAHSAGLGQGSEFVVSLATVTVPGIRPAITPATHERSADTSLRVLVVDDSVDGCTMLASLLKHTGHSVQMAHTGADGLHAALEWRPDVVLLDIGLPEIDGYEVARRLRQEPIMKDTKLVALTGYGADSDRQLAREAGFDAYTVKPIEFGDLAKLLAEITGSQSSQS